MDRETENRLFNLFMTILIAAVCMATGIAIGGQATRQMAIDAGVAYYTVSAKGEPEFHFGVPPEKGGSDASR